MRDTPSIAAETVARKVGQKIGQKVDQGRDQTATAPVASLEAGNSVRLEIRNLERQFGGQRVVCGISLQLNAGQVTCLLGPSGCGKSTTLRIIAGVDVQDAGEVWMDGQMMAGPGVFVPPEKRGIGLMFQDFALFPHLSVADNVAFGLTGSRTEKRIRVQELLDKVGLARFIDKFPHQLSGGEQQRVALARALAPRPSIMLMDEPFSGLDNRLRDGIRDETLTLLKEEGTAVVMVTHDPEEAMRMADEIALMRRGEIVQRGAPYNIYNTPVDKEAAGFFSDINIIHGEVQGALIKTAFGKFLTPGMCDGCKVDIVIRPQHLKIDLDRGGHGPDPTEGLGVWARGTVCRARFIGKESLVEFEMEDGTCLTATVPSVFLPKPGMVLWLSMPRDRCFVFPATAG